MTVTAQQIPLHLNSLRMAQVLLDLETMPDVCRNAESNQPNGADADVLLILDDGLLEPRSTHSLAYVEALARDGVRLRVLSFENPTDLDDGSRIRHAKLRLDPTRAEWTALRSHQKPRVLGTLMDILVGALTAVRMARGRPPHVVHTRSYVAGLIGYIVKLTSGARFVFDMQGFWPEERVEMGLFRAHGFFYRASKRCERVLLAAADHIVVLTESAKAILRDREAHTRLAAKRNVRETPITVIPHGVDLERFRPGTPVRELEAAHGLENKIVIGNVGAASKRYMLVEMFRFAFHLKSHRPETRFVYLTADDDATIRVAAAEAGLRHEDVLVLSVEPSEIPQWLTLFRLGVFFLRPSYAAKGSSYPELAEFLACGVPVVTNTGVGDVDALLRDDRTRVLVSGLTENDLAAAARHALELLEGDLVPDDVRDACRSTAAKTAHLDLGARRLVNIYRNLMARSSAEPRSSIAMETG